MRGGRRKGVWTRPDCVLVYYPARRRSLDEKPTLATFEIEAPCKFDIRSVYEAHAHGFGADYSWVLFFRDVDPDLPAPHRDWHRIDWAAKSCGVGLISLTNPGSASTWVAERGAVRRTDGDRTEFIQRAIPRQQQPTADRTLPDMKAPN